ncbi:uncharacterized protein LOC133800377 [Humulus lupulus]|uniref:uncharacterized protein LOC133800377 n=1 Tax=Humulus lupulus TaxID=3486 RepID=UPI002B406FBF|nr:uncharacterized protein LOC133800377 [Humulus lupulus]
MSNHPPNFKLAFFWTDDFAPSRFYSFQRICDMDSDLDNVINRPSVAKALASFVQHNFKLNNEVFGSRAHSQEAKNLRLKLADELKAATLKVSELESKLEAALESAQKVSDLESMMAVALKEFEAKNYEIKEKDSKIKELQELNAKLEEEKKATFEIIEGEKARLLEEFKTKKDHFVDMHLGKLEAEFIEKWQARLEEEEDKLEAEKKVEAPGAAGGEASTL